MESEKDGSEVDKARRRKSEVTGLVRASAFFSEKNIVQCFVF